jgi:hypothetical protein
MKRSPLADSNRRPPPLPAEPGLGALEQTLVHAAGNHQEPGPARHGEGECELNVMHPPRRPLNSRVERRRLSWSCDGGSLERLRPSSTRK